MTKNKIIDTLKGVAIGDAFGVGIEFKSRHWIKDNVDFTKFINVWKGGKNNISPGTYSDDTEHTIGLVEALVSGERFTEELLLEKWKAEYEYDKQLKGFPRDGHGSIEKWYKGEKTIEEVREEQASRTDPGNAPVMRAVPLSFIAQEDLGVYSRINADATHPHDMARAASCLTALVGWHFLRDNGTNSDLMNFLTAYIGTPTGVNVRNLLRMINMLPAPEKLKESDYQVLHGVQPLPFISWDPNIYGLPCASMKTALNVAYVMKHATTTFEALKYAINMGGDVDSLAAVCTGIAAGKYGLDTLPAFMLEQTEGMERMEGLGEKMYNTFFSPVTA